MDRPTILERPKEIIGKGTSVETIIYIWRNKCFTIRNHNLLEDQ